MPTIEPGALAVGEVTIDGTNIQYVSIVPVDFTVGDTAPVLLALPPGAQDLSTTTGVAHDRLPWRPGYNRTSPQRNGSHRARQCR